MSCTVDGDGNGNGNGDGDGNSERPLRSYKFVPTKEDNKGVINEDAGCCFVDILATSFSSERFRCVG